MCERNKAQKPVNGGFNFPCKGNNNIEIAVDNLIEKETGVWECIQQKVCL